MFCLYINLQNIGVKLVNLYFLHALKLNLFHADRSFQERISDINVALLVILFSHKKVRKLNESTASYFYSSVDSIEIINITNVNLLKVMHH